MRTDSCGGKTPSYHPLSSDNGVCRRMAASSTKHSRPKIYRRVCRRCGQIFKGTCLDSRCRQCKPTDLNGQPSSTAACERHADRSKSGEPDIILSKVFGLHPKFMRCPKHGLVVDPCLACQVTNNKSGDFKRRKSRTVCRNCLKPLLAGESMLDDLCPRCISGPQPGDPTPEHIAAVAAQLRMK